jgi:hypothetical protein
MVIVRPPLAVVHWGGQRAGAAGRAERGCPGVTPGAGADGHGDVHQAGDGPGVKIDDETILGEVACHAGGGWHLMLLQMPAPSMLSSISPGSTASRSLQPSIRYSTICHDH